MKVLHVEMSGGLGGIQTLTRDVCLNSTHSINDIYFINGGGTIMEEMQQLGIHVVCDGSSFKYHIFRKTKCLSKFIVQNKYNVVVFHDMGIVSCLCLKKINKLTNIVTLMYEHSDPCHQIKFLQLKNRFYRYCYIYGMKKVDRIIAISNFVSRQGKLVCPNKKTTTIYNGINYKTFSKLQFHNPNDVLEVLFVGRLIEGKGIQVLLKAITLLPKNVEVHLTIVGDGIYKNDLVNLQDELNIANQVTFAGATTNVSKYYEQSDVFIHPAIWNEGFGITLIEAMSSGLPCIAFNRGALNEIISDGYNGFLINEVDPSELSKKIEYIYSIFRKQNYVTLRRNAKASSQKFDIKNTISKLESTYNELLEIKTRDR